MDKTLRSFRTGRVTCLLYCVCCILFLLCLRKNCLQWLVLHWTKTTLKPATCSASAGPPFFCSKFCQNPWHKLSIFSIPNTQCHNYHKSKLTMTRCYSFVSGKINKKKNKKSWTRYITKNGQFCVFLWQAANSTANGMKIHVPRMLLAMITSLHNDKCSKHVKKSAQ